MNVKITSVLNVLQDSINDKKTQTEGLKMLKDLCVDSRKLLFPLTF